MLAFSVAKGLPRQALKVPPCELPFRLKAIAPACTDSPYAKPSVRVAFQAKSGCTHSGVLSGVLYQESHEHIFCLLFFGFFSFLQGKASQSYRQLGKRFLVLL
jgi:hypothetical protein